ncbi:hypothetical protein BGX27_007865 [Mortierella sp. AM989]|nr:hypothetical protein BGX27_007865 [Mortierella sp. AM989]
MTDLVTQVKIVDSNGTLNTFTKEKDPVEFSAAGVNLGLLGMIYSYTMKVEPMFNLRMVDTHPLVDDFFNDPKVGGPKIKSMVLRNDQTQFFYWPFNGLSDGISDDSLWIKEWQRTNATASDTPLGDALGDVVEGLRVGLGSNVFDFMAANPSTTPLLLPIMYQAVSADKSVVLHAPNAIHYLAGAEQVECLAIEMLFKVDANFENVVKAWKYVTDEIYAYAEKDEYPINLTMEMRFIKSSSMIMSPAYDEDPEAIYCAMEIVSIVKTRGFEEFSVKVAKYWMDNFQANPHWAKMWEQVPGIVPYLRQKARTRYDTFETIRKKYDPNGMFMTGTFAGLLGH